MKKFLTTILPLIFVTLSLVSTITYAANHPDNTAQKGYVPLAKLPGITDPNKEVPLEQYLIILYKVGIWTAVILAIASIIWGGVQYITSAGGEGKGAGKEMIQSAIFGLLLALGSYIILSTINKDLLELNFTIGGEQQQ